MVYIILSEKALYLLLTNMKGFKQIFISKYIILFKINLM